jgi:hypothetical protein
VTIQAQRRPGDALTPEDMTCEHLGPVATTRKQQRRAAAFILDQFGNADCTKLAEVGEDARTILDALFQPPYRTPPGNRPRTHDAVLTYNGATPNGQPVPATGISAEAQAFRRACRAWGRRNGWQPTIRGSLNPAMEAEYRTWLVTNGGAG